MLTRTERVATCDNCGCAIRRGEDGILVEWEPTEEELLAAEKAEEAEDGQRFLCAWCAKDDGLVDVWMDSMRREHPGCDVTEGEL